MEDLGIFYGLWSISRPIGLFNDHLVYFVVIWYIIYLFGMLYLKNLATLELACCT
jgi:hypothetical protein